MPKQMYRWATPHAWLTEKARGWTAKELLETLVLLAAGATSDTLQDLFEEEMTEDGYFDTLEDRT